MYIGKVLDVLEASHLGFSIVFIGKERKMAKVYVISNTNIFYNVAIIVDSSSHIKNIDIYRVERKDESKTEVSQENEISDEIRSILEQDLSKMIVK